MNDFIQKFTSRKFLLALVGVVSGLSLAFGVEVGEINNTVTTIAGIITALGSIGIYNIAEAKVDAAAVSATTVCDSVNIVTEKEVTIDGEQ